MVSNRSVPLNPGHRCLGVEADATKRLSEDQLLLPSACVADFSSYYDKYQMETYPPSPLYAHMMHVYECAGALTYA